MADHTGRHRSYPPVSLRVLGTVVVFVAFAFWLGLNVGYSKSQQVASLAILSDQSAFPPEGVDFGPLWKAWHILENKFVSATTTAHITSDEMLWGAVSGLASSYNDPYTTFFPPAEATAFAEDINGSFGGVGMEVGMRGGFITVIAPLKASPAEKAGIKSEDRIMEIDGVSTDGLTVDEAVQKIRGDVGTSVKLVIAREGESSLITIEIIRAIINIPTIDAHKRDDGVFVISLYNFSARSASLFSDVLQDFIRSDSNKLVIDLRNNPGGYLESAVDIASWFLPAGKVVVSEDFGKNQTDQIHRSRGYGPLSKPISVVVVVNEGSASASEILAGALKEHGVATIIGKTTFGKGSVQELVDITSKTSLKVTVARWLTPHGNSISDGGLDPDITVDITKEDIEAGRDPQLDKAVEFLLQTDN
ncbi:MAG TPA: S41 family peptidase [Candidatus Paceibacterota bacterium]